MGKMEDLARKLEEQREEAQNRELNAEDEKVTFLENLRGLHESILRWIKPLREKNLVAVERRELELREDQIGVYKAPEITLKGDGWSPGGSALSVASSSALEVAST